MKPFSSRLVSTGELYFWLLESTRTSHCLRWYQGSSFKKSNKTYGNLYLSVAVWHAEFWNKLLNLCWIFLYIIWILFRETHLEPSQTYMMGPFAKTVNYFCKSTSSCMLNWVLNTPRLIVKGTGFSHIFST